MVRRWLDRLLRRATLVSDWDRLEVGLVEVEGTVRGLELLSDPVEGTPCVAMEYRAWPPSTTVGVDGSSVVGARAYQVVASQAVDFLLEGSAGALLVRPLPGENVASHHRQLEAQYGLNLRSEVHQVCPGDFVRVRGRVVHLASGSESPHRAAPYRAIVAAEQLRRA